jgi:hypothetical protein
MSHDSMSSEVDKKYLHREPDAYLTAEIRMNNSDCPMLATKQARPSYMRVANNIIAGAWTDDSNKITYQPISQRCHEQYCGLVQEFRN